MKIILLLTFKRSMTRLYITVTYSARQGKNSSLNFQNFMEYTYFMSRKHC